MLKSTYKLATLYKNEGKLELSQKVLELDLAIRDICKVSILPDPQKRYYCPTCRKEIDNLEEVDFMLSVGECGTCDHVRGDLG